MMTRSRSLMLTARPMSTAVTTVCRPPLGRRQRDRLTDVTREARETSGRARGKYGRANGDAKALDPLFRHPQRAHTVGDIK